MHGSKKIILLILLAFAACLPATATWAGEALVNSDVEVDVTGKDAADARAQAMAKGEVQALSDLLGKLTSPEQAENIVTNLDAKKIGDIVRGTEVLDEKISANRYRAHLLVTFDGNEISSLISKIGAAGGNNGEEPTTIGSYLIIPGYQEDNAQMLWEDANPWRSIWKTVGLEITSGDIVVPFGDNADIGIVDAKSIASANYASLAPMLIRYGVSDIVVLQATFTHTPDMTLSVVRRHISRSVNEVTLLTYRADPQETKDMLFGRAARDIADNILHAKVEEAQVVKTVRGGERNSVMVLASITTLASWTQLRNKLGTLPMIDRLEMLAIAPQQVDMVIHYRGSPESLADAITAQNIRLVKNSGYWVISRD